MAQRVEYVGEGKDEHGFHCQVLVNRSTGAGYLAYDLETWERRCQFLSELIRLRERQESADRKGKAA